VSYTLAGLDIGNPEGRKLDPREADMTRILGIFAALTLTLLLSEPASGQC